MQLLAPAGLLGVPLFFSHLPGPGTRCWRSPLAGVGYKEQGLLDCLITRYQSKTHLIRGFEDAMSMEQADLTSATWTLAQHELMGQTRAQIHFRSGRSIPHCLKCLLSSSELQMWIIMANPTCNSREQKLVSSSLKELHEYPVTARSLERPGTHHRMPCQHDHNITRTEKVIKVSMLD